MLSVNGSASPKPRRSPQHKKINGQTAPWAEDRPKAEMLEDYKGFNKACIGLIESIPKTSVWGILYVKQLVHRFVKLITALPATCRLCRCQLATE